MFKWLRKLSRRSVIGEIIKDYGVFSDEKLLGRSQTVRLLRCKKGNKEFFVFECISKFPSKFFGFECNWYKVSLEGLKRLQKITGMFQNTDVNPAVVHHEKSRVP